jgi:hypothetical protein
MVGNLRAAHALQPENWFCAWRGGEVVGLVGGYDYGPFASIGMMAVHPAAQRQGVGHALMAHLLARLGAPVALLDASGDGQRLYPRLGFVAEGETLRLNLPARDEAQTSPVPSVPPLAEQDLADVVAFDAPIFGAERPAVLRSFWRAAPERALLARGDDGRIAGFLFSNESHIGPWSALTPRAAEQLLSAALAMPWRVPPMLTCPADNRDAIALLGRTGFVVTERLLHMRHGGTSDPRQTVYLFGQASLTLG